jgi:hypothetical protein
MMILSRCLLFSFILICTYYKGTKLVAISNIFLIISSATLFFFFDNDIISLCDTILVIGFLLNIFSINYNNSKLSFYNKFLSVVSFANVISFAIYLFAMIYDVSLGFSLDADASPIKWFVDFVGEFKISSSNCSPSPNSIGAVDDVLNKWERANTAANNTSKSIETFTCSIRPYVQAFSGGSLVATAVVYGPITKSAPLPLKTGLVVGGMGLSFLFNSK